MSKQVIVRLEEEALALLDKRCGGPNQSAGVKGGRGGYIAELVYRDLEYTPKDYHRFGDEDRLELAGPLQSLDKSTLYPCEVRIIELLAENKTYAEIAETLDREGVHTKREGAWSRATVWQMVQTLNRRASREQEAKAS